ncbi:MAG: citrate transporter, partial [Oscillospiraceae bacterium]|nr:citrate transporter [Oscillospiraceae bacterium]
MTVFKQETVLCIACILAVISAFIVPPDAQYLSYIDFRTLGILFCLMAVMAGLQGIGVFEMLAQRMLLKVRNMRQLVPILTMLCFISSMVMTNDVALITFVPFTFIVLGLVGESEKERHMIPIVVMQTVAANLGSMLTP